MLSRLRLWQRPRPQRGRRRPVAKSTTVPPARLLLRSLPLLLLAPPLLAAVAEEGGPDAREELERGSLACVGRSNVDSAPGGVHCRGRGDARRPARGGVNAPGAQVPRLDPMRMRGGMRGGR